ncbi:MAG: diguanylate cyclase [Planctomycetota bacterium]
MTWRDRGEPSRTPSPAPISLLRRSDDPPAAEPTALHLAPPPGATWRRVARQTTQVVRAAADWCTGQVGQPRMVLLLLLVLAPAAVTLLFALYGASALQRFPAGLPAGSTASRVVAAAIALGGLAALWAAALGILWLRSTAAVIRQTREIERLDWTLMRQARDLRDARDHAEMLTAMREVSRVVAGGHDFDTVMGDVMRILDDFIQPQDATIYLDDGDGRLVPRASLSRNEAEAMRARGGATQAARRHQMIRVVDADKKSVSLFIPFETDHGAPGVLRIVRELEADAQARGLMDSGAPRVLIGEGEAHAHDPQRLPDACRARMEAFERRIVYFIKHVALAVRHLTLYDRATVDGLTRLFNRQTCDRHLQRLTARADHDGLPLAVLMIDIDHFKKVNDNHGHLSGDLVLAGVASVLRQSLRDGDLAFRYGGEEMTVLLPDSDAATARAVAEHVRAQIAATDLRGEHGQRIPTSASIGVAVYRAFEGVSGFLSRADVALYRSKEGGRNRVTLADGEPLQATAA